MRESTNTYFSGETLEDETECCKERSYSYSYKTSFSSATNTLGKVLSAASVSVAKKSHIQARALMHIKMRDTTATNMTDIELDG